MINKLKQMISKYITNYSDTENWKETRLFYSAYSYISFLIMALNNMGAAISNIKKSAIDAKLESEEILDYLLSIDGMSSFIAEITPILSNEKVKNIDILYQDFLSADYITKNNSLLFEAGKSNRNLLGSYYTQNDFASEIVKKTLDEYLKNDNHPLKNLQIADFSCGGGAFLISAQEYCNQRNIPVELYGIDVDPIAVMITRARLYINKTQFTNTKSIRILLGNPLLEKHPNSTVIDSFLMSLTGRYYHPYLGLNIEKNFDIIIGNPPWEKIRFEEKKFLMHYAEDSSINTKQERQRFINQAASKNKAFFTELSKDYANAKIEIKKNTLFKNTKNGELNTYALFSELALNTIRESGIIGLIVKSSLFKMPVYCNFMKDIILSKKIFELYMFVNKNKIFNIDSREEFSVVFFKGQNQNPLRISVNLENYRNFYKCEQIILSKKILDLLNPETGMLPNVKNNNELNFLCQIYSNNSTFGEIYKDCRFGRLVHLTNHSQYIIQNESPGYSPVYEGKFIELYTAKYATFQGIETAEKYKNKASARLIENILGNEYPEARFFIRNDIWNNLSKDFTDNYVIAWRSLTSATNRRTMLASILPLMPTCQSIQILQYSQEEKMLHILALFNSIIFDYIVRLKMAGLDLTQTIIKQIPVPDETRYTKKIVFCNVNATINTHILSRLNNLYKNDKRITQLFTNKSVYLIEGKSRKQIIAELDILVGKLYGLSKTDIKKIAYTFDKFYLKEEVEQWF